VASTRFEEARPFNDMPGSQRARGEEGERDGLVTEGIGPALQPRPANMHEAGAAFQSPASELSFLSFLPFFPFPFFPLSPFPLPLSGLLSSPPNGR